MKQSYPIIHLPHGLELLIKSLPLQYKEYIKKPDPPRKPIIYEPKKPDLVESNKPKVALIFILFSIFLMGITGLEEMDLIFVIPISAFSTWQAANLFSNNSEARNKSAIDGYNRSIENNKKLNDDYQQALKEYEKRKDLHNNLMPFEEYLSTEIHKWMKENYFRMKVGEEQNINRGVTEDYFFKELRTALGNTVIQDVKVTTFNFEFYPDIVYKCPKTGLLVDIEIDEPYVGYNGKPIHQKDLYDDFRNLSFLGSRWIVVRLTERQVVQNLGGCLKLIKSISDLTFFQNMEFDIDIEKRWSEEVAYEMAFKRYRDSYLPKNLREKLTVEKFKEIENLDKIDWADDLPF